MKKSFVVASLLLIGCAATENNRSWDLDAEWGFTTGIEGAAHDANGNLYAVNVGKEDGTIGIIKAESNKAELFLNMPEGSICNGIVFDKKGIIYMADYTEHNIWRYDGDSLTVLAHNPIMNQPNDLAITPSGEFLFASDPNWAENCGQLWRASVASGELVLVEGDMGTTNGVEVSPDGKRLYVNESNQLNVWCYDLNESGEISNKRLFVKFEDFGMDGMRCDVDGNLYITRYDKGSVVKISEGGEIVKEWSLSGKKCCNITLVADKGYVTMADRGCFEVIALY